MRRIAIAVFLAMALSGTSLAAQEVKEGGAAVQANVNARLSNPELERQLDAFVFFMDGYESIPDNWIYPKHQGSFRQHDLLWRLDPYNFVSGRPGQRIWQTREEANEAWASRLRSRNIRQQSSGEVFANVYVFFVTTPTNPPKSPFVVWPCKLTDQSGLLRICLQFTTEFYSAFLFSQQSADQKEKAEQRDVLEEMRNPDISEQSRWELVYRLGWMSAELHKLHFLLQDDNLSRILACVEEEAVEVVPGDVDRKKRLEACASLFWKFEYGQVEAWFNLVSKKEMKVENEYVVVLPTPTGPKQMKSKTRVSLVFRELDQYVFEYRDGKQSVRKRGLKAYTLKKLLELYRNQELYRSYWEKLAD